MIMGRREAKDASAIPSIASESQRHSGNFETECQLLCLAVSWRVDVCHRPSQSARNAMRVASVLLVGILQFCFVSPIESLSVSVVAGTRQIRT